MYGKENMLRNFCYLKTSPQILIKLFEIEYSMLREVEANTLMTVISCVVCVGVYVCL